MMGLLMIVQENVALAPLTTLQVGGAARFFVAADSIAAVQEAVQFASSQRLSLLVLGGGSNVVISDAGWPGLVLKVAVCGTDQREEAGKIVFEVGAGEDWDAFVARAVSHECAGVECLSGIPGSVGGTPVQNVGAYGQEVADTIESVLVFDLRDYQIRELCAEACGFGYRTSLFNTSERGRYIILRVTYALTQGVKPKIEYADLKKYFAGRSTTPTLAEARLAVREIRASKAMLIAPGDEDSRSLGSFFKNPIVSEAKYQELAERSGTRGLEIPSYPAAKEQRKIPAAWLVEHSGFSKGYSAGHAGISRKHALAIVNRGGATAAEIVGLKNSIQQHVQETWGIQLETEPVFVGF
jgi:UDP-N-acetylmuramate dehydrogenase